MTNKATMPRMHWKLLEQCPPYPIIAKKATQDFLIRDSGSVGRAVASDSRGSWFKSSHRQKFISNIYVQLFWKDENKEKEAGNGPFKKVFLIRSTLEIPYINAFELEGLTSLPTCIGYLKKL